MHNTNTSSINPVGAQATNEPEIRLHHDGRVSYKDNKPALRLGVLSARPRLAPPWPSSPAVPSFSIGNALAATGTASRAHTPRAD